jgi:methylmalonyl-CoA mutase
MSTLRAAPVVLLGDRHELLHGSRQDARRAAAVGQAAEAIQSEGPALAVAAHPFADLRLVADRAGRVQQRRPHQHRSHGGDAGHTQSLHTNALDEALALPTDFSARIARNTQLFLQQESGTTRVIDPWGGSYYVERLTHDLAAKAWAHIQEVEELGGMAKAIEAGVPKLRIEEASAKTQARIDAGKQSVIGVNKYKPENEAAIDVLKVENSTVRRLQIDKLSRLRSERKQADVDAALAAITRSAGEGNGNLLALAIDAARAKATVGEISDAMEKVFGRHRAEIKSITGVYKREAAMSDRVEKLAALIDAFEDAEGRRPRILVAKIGQDGHDRGQKVIASAFADVGFDVDIGPLFATADEAARQPSRTTSTCSACHRWLRRISPRSPN